VGGIAEQQALLWTGWKQSIHQKATLSR
jgi:hypothetical protein